MIFGKHINRYYLRHFPLLFLGVLALVAVDYLQLIIPNLYGMVIAGMDEGVVEQGGILYTFDMAFLLDKICMPMVVVIFIIVLGRMVWRVCFLGSSIMMEEDLRNRMFSHNRELSREYYQVNKVGGLMSLYTNDLDNLQACCSFCNKAKDDSLGEEFFTRIERIFLYQAKLRYGKKQFKKLKKMLKEISEE
jgi:ATP-binding cassette subfamily B protein